MTPSIDVRNWALLMASLQEAGQQTEMVNVYVCTSYCVDRTMESMGSYLKQKCMYTVVQESILALLRSRSNVVKKKENKGP